MNGLPPPDADTDLRDDVLAWCVRRGRTDWNASDEAALQSWLTQAPARRAAFDRWQTHWQALDALPAESVAALRRRLAADQAREAAPSVPARGRRLVPLFAMAGVLAVASGTALLAWRHWLDQPLYVQSFGTQRGQQLEAQLPDGSRLRLDTATRLEVAYDRQRRELTLLDGQALFSVTADAARPFQVLAGPMRITVLGTRFSVRYTPGQPGAAGVQVAVEHGRVHVARRDGSSGAATDIQLVAGQQVTADANGALAPVGTVPGEGVAPWRNHRISFVDTPLDQALAELGRYAATGLVVRDPAAAALRLSGTFDPRDVQTLRRMLPSALPVRLRPFGEQTEIVPAR